MRVDMARARAIDENRKLQRAGIRTGKRRIYWLGYHTENGEWVRECYTTQGQMRTRAFELLKKGIS